MSDAATLAQRQLDAYNAHDLEAFVACYAEDVVIRRLVDNAVLMQGREALRAGYGPMFAEGRVHAALVSRMVLGPVAIDEERVTGHPSGDVVRAIAHYEVRDGVIRQVWFVREAD